MTSVGVKLFCVWCIQSTYKMTRWGSCQEYKKIIHWDPYFLIRANALVWLLMTSVYCCPKGTREMIGGTLLGVVICSQPWWTVESLRSYYHKMMNMSLLPIQINWAVVVDLKTLNHLAKSKNEYYMGVVLKLLAWCERWYPHLLWKDYSASGNCTSPKWTCQWIQVNP